ncbi:MAG: transglycosylase domain-containing protein [bacterium]|nr:transglycosylase domain-containing protein [bacterium]
MRFLRVERLWRTVKKHRIATILTFFSVFVALWVYVLPYDLPTEEEMFGFSPQLSGKIITSDGVPLGEFGREYRTFVPYKNIPKTLEYAVLSAEDKEFWWHPGVNPFRMIIMAIENSLAGKIKGGASTMTQQVVRMRFLQEEMYREWHKKPSGKHERWFRKIREARMALRWEFVLWRHFGWNRRKAKEVIFEQYASLVFLGRFPSPKGGAPQYGFVAASDFYFGKKLADLEPHEAALLAALIQNPVKYSPFKKGNEEEALGRRFIVLDRMHRNGYLTRDQFETYIKKPLGVRDLRTNPWNARSFAPSAVGFALESLSKEDRDRLYLFGPAVFTTIDASVQNIADAALENGLLAYRQRHYDQPEKQKKITGLALVLKNNGDIVAVSEGGTNPWYGFRYLWQANRQLGSAFKPFVYLALLAHGWGIGRDDEKPCLLNDGYVSVKMGNGKRKTINNYDGKHKGIIPCWLALAESRNAATMWAVLHMVDINDVIRIAKQAGLKGNFSSYVDAKGDVHHYPTAALGAVEATPLNIALAYATIANGGCLIDKGRIVDRVMYPTGIPEEFPGKDFKNDCAQVIPQDTEAKLLAMLRGPILWQHGTAHYILGKGSPWLKNGPPLPFPVIAKTGTTNNFKDAWISISTCGQKGYTVLVWLGFEDNTSIGDDAHGVNDPHKEPGGKGPGKIAKTIMEDLYQDVPPEKLPTCPEFSEQMIRDAITQGQTGFSKK